MMINREVVEQLKQMRAKLQFTTEQISNIQKHILIICTCSNKTVLKQLELSRKFYQAHFIISLVRT